MTGLPFTNLFEFKRGGVEKKKAINKVHVSRGQRPIYWEQANIWVFIAQLVEHCSANAEAMGSNPVEAKIFFFGLKFAIA